MAIYNYFKKLYFDTIPAEGLKSMFYDWFNNFVLPSKNVKYIYLAVYDSICLISMRVHDLSVQTSVNTINCKLSNGDTSFFSYKYRYMFPILALQIL